MSDDQEEVIKGKLSAAKVYSLYEKLDHEQQEVFKDQVSELIRTARRSSVLSRGDRNDDQDEELREKIKELEEDKLELMNDYSEKSNAVELMKKKYDALHTEYSANVNKNRQLNMDLVESRLMFKQQCCVLVYFLKIARKQLVKFKTYLLDLGYESMNECIRYKYFGRKIVSQQEEVIHKEFKLRYGYTCQNKN